LTAREKPPEADTKKTKEIARNLPSDRNDSALIRKLKMKTDKQNLGMWGEALVAKMCSCPRCKKKNTLRRLPQNFKCADLICDFCGYLAQVKTANVASVTPLPRTILGAAWKPQKERMDAAIFFPLFLALKSPTAKAIYYLPTDFQNPELFLARSPLKTSAKKAGWQGFRYILSAVPDGAFVRLL
jgi:type II restriction enzyme